MEGHLPMFLRQGTVFNSAMWWLCQINEFQPQDTEFPNPSFTKRMQEAPQLGNDGSDDDY